MAVILALEKLYTDVKARILAEVPAASVEFGWRAKDRQDLPLPRIVWVPGDPAGDLGSLNAARYPGRNPRPLATLGELFTVYLTAQDASEPSNEFRQWYAARRLYDDWIRHVYLSAYGTFEILSQAWETEKKVMRHGATLRVVGAIQSMIPDLTHDSAPVDTHAEVEAESLDVTEIFEVHPD